MRHVDLQYRDANSACGHWTALQITGTMRDVLPVTLEDAFCMQISLSSCLLFQIYPPDGKKDIRSKEPAALSSELEVRLLVEGGYFALACLFDSSSDFRSPPPHTHTLTLMPYHFQKCSRSHTEGTHESLELFPTPVYKKVITVRWRRAWQEPCDSELWTGSTCWFPPSESC